MSVQNVSTVVVGAGPAGLAVSACLKARGVEHVLLERGPSVATVWRGHYDRLHLHTDRAHSGLPHRPMPSDYPRYPSRDQVTAYLESYVTELGLAPRFGQSVQSIERKDSVWIVRTNDSVFTAKNVVVCTGFMGAPQEPKWPGQERFAGPIVHSSRYTNGKAFAGKRVLIIGFGNSGGEIAIDLHEHGAKPAIAVRSAVNIIPKELFGIPILAMSIAMRALPARVADAINAPILRMVIGDIEKLGFRKQPYGPLTQIEKDGRVPLIDIGTLKLIREGHVQVFGGVRSFTEGGVVFESGREERFDAVVLATGYLPRVDHILPSEPDTYDARGVPTKSGVALKEGLFFCGYYIAPTGMLREIGIEAKRIASLIA